MQYVNEPVVVLTRHEAHLAMQALGTEIATIDSEIEKARQSNLEGEVLRLTNVQQQYINLLHEMNAARV